MRFIADVAFTAIAAVACANFIVSFIAAAVALMNVWAAGGT